MTKQELQLVHEVKTDVAILKEQQASTAARLATESQRVDAAHIDVRAVNERLNSLDVRLARLETQFAEFRKITEDKTLSTRAWAGIVLSFLIGAAGLAVAVYNAVKK